MAIIQAMVSKSPIQFIGGITGSTLSSGVSSATFTGHQTGDLLIAMGGSQQTADPTFTSGWTKITSYNSTVTTLRVGILVYKFASSSNNDTITFTGTGTSTANYSAGYIFRNVRAIGNSNVVTNVGATASTTIASPSLTLSDTATGQSALVLSTYIATITAAPNSMTAINGLAYGLLRSSWAGGNFTSSGAVTAACGIVELLN